MTKVPNSFRWGDLAKIALEAKLTRQRLHNALTGRRNLGPGEAQLLVDAAAKWCYQTNVFDWMFPLETTNPLFKRFQRSKKKGG